MSKSKILYVCQEIYPYLPDSDMANHCRHMVQAMQERGNEIRTFMPRYGCINERRNQLHEVIRLSGMNLIIDDNDHQLIIKVASIPSARVQIYFIDNDDYFNRKATLCDASGTEFADNDERAIFFARGVLETVKKLRWQPQIVHCHGWFSSVIPIYLKNTFADDPLFQNVKIVVSLYDDVFVRNLNDDFKTKIENEGIGDPKLQIIENPSYQNLAKLVIDYADAIVIEGKNVDAGILEYIEKSGKPTVSLPCDRSDNQYVDSYQKLYDEIIK